jgi:hypothetical protein
MNGNEWKASLRRRCDTCPVQLYEAADVLVLLWSLVEITSGMRVGK